MVMVWMSQIFWVGLQIAMQSEIYVTLISYTIADYSGSS